MNDGQNMIMKIVKVGLYILKYMYIVYKCLIYKQIFFLKYIHACIYIYLIHVHNAHTYMTLAQNQL